jgi:hypothetical protein
MGGRGERRFAEEIRRRSTPKQTKRAGGRHSSKRGGWGKNHELWEEDKKVRGVVIAFLYVLDSQDFFRQLTTANETFGTLD